jgi:hypothetical protein
VIGAGIFKTPSVAAGLAGDSGGIVLTLLGRVRVNLGLLLCFKNRHNLPIQWRQQNKSPINMFHIVLFVSQRYKIMWKRFTNPYFRNKH